MLSLHVKVVPKLYSTRCQHPTSHIRSSDDPQPVVTHVTVVVNERALPQAGHNRMCPTPHFKHGFFHHIRSSVTLWWGGVVGGCVVGGERIYSLHYVHIMRSKFISEKP